MKTRAAYLIVGGQRNGEWIENSEGQRFLSLRRMPMMSMLPPLKFPTETSTQSPRMVDDYVLTPFRFDDGRRIEVYRLIGLSDEEATELLMHPRA